MTHNSYDYSFSSMFSNVNFKKCSAIFGGVFLFGILFGYVLFPSMFKGLIAKVSELDVIAHSNTQDIYDLYLRKLVSSPAQKFVHSTPKFRFRLILKFMCSI